MRKTDRVEHSLNCLVQISFTFIFEKDCLLPGGDRAKPLERREREAFAGFEFKSMFIENDLTIALLFYSMRTSIKSP